MREQLWLSIFLADLSDPVALTRIAVDHCLAPAREAWGLPAPVPGEGDGAFFYEAVVNGNRVQMMREHSLTISAAHFDPVIRGSLLFAWLFPGSTSLTDTPEEVANLPGPAFLSESQLLAYRTHEEVEYLVAGLFGLEREAPRFHGMNPYRQQANPDVLTEMACIQKVLGEAVGRPEDLGDYRREDLGLQAVDQFAAFAIDEILRESVHQRLVWLANWEEADPESPRVMISPLDLITFDRGVFMAAVPETLAGLVALDFAESLRLDRIAGRCARCDRPMLLTAQQAARARRGKTIFHEECHAEHRLSYFRDYQATRAARSARGGPDDGA